MTKFVPPKFLVKAFTCASCGTYAQQSWNSSLYFESKRPGSPRLSVKLPIARGECSVCNAVTYWSTKHSTPILPRTVQAPLPHPDLPESCQSEFAEARNVFADSPRAAAALLRLCVQQLVKELGQPGKNIDRDIATLVQSGLPELVQKSLDICRVTGNNAVHPGQISTDDTAELTGQIFHLINFIVSQTIERKKSIDTLYSKLPEGALQAIAKRDGV